MVDENRGQGQTCPNHPDKLLVKRKDTRQTDTQKWGWFCPLLDYQLPREVERP